MKKLLLLVTSVVFITSCGGGGGGGGGDASGGNTTTPPTVSVSAGPEKLYLGYRENATVNYNYSNATSCSGSGSLPSSIGSGSGSGSYGFFATTAGTFTFTITCTNSGGSNSASTTITVFERYYKQTETVINKNWDAEGLATITEGMFLGNGYLTSFDYSGYDNLLTVTAFEPSAGGFELGYSGSTAEGNSFDFNLVFSDWNTSTELLYDPDDATNPAYAFITTTFADAVVNGFLTLPDYFSSNFQIEYVASGLIEIFTNPSYYVIPTSIGEYTKSGDVPTSGTTTKNFDTLGYYYEASVEAGNAFAGYIVGDGSGTLDFDFTNNTVSGSITYDTFVPYASFKNGTGAYNLITTIPDQTITIQNGTISENSFSAQIILSDGETQGEGIIQGHFYGPNADEIGISLILLDADSNESDYFIFTAGGIGQ